MILQTDTRLNESINKSGCYLMSALFFLNKYTGLMLSCSIINYLHIELQGVIGWDNNPCINDNCYISDITKIFNYLDFNVTYTGVHESVDYICKPNQFEILCLKHINRNIYHFVCGDGNGNIMYNSMGINNPDYKLYSKRIFIINK